MSKYALVVMLTTLLCSNIYAQFGIIQDAEGYTALYLPHGTAALDFKEEKLKMNASINVIPLDSGGILIHPNLEVDAINGRTMLFQDNRFQFKGTFGSAIVWKYRNIYVYFNASGTRSKVNLWDSLAVRISEKEVNQFTGQLGFTHSPLNANLIWGVGARYGESNNMSDLEKADYSYTMTQQQSNGTRLLKFSQSDVLGPIDSLITNQRPLILMGDVFWNTPNYGIKGHIRYINEDKTGEKGFFNLGGGIYLNGTSTNQFQGGLILDFVDILSTNESTNILEKARLSLVVGFSL